MSTTQTRKKSSTSNPSIYHLPFAGKKDKSFGKPSHHLAIPVQIPMQNLLE